MERTEARDDHDKFKELSALAHANSLSATEQLELEQHLHACPSCRQIYDEYSVIGDVGMTFLAGSSAPTREAERWDDREMRLKLLSSIGGLKPPRVVSIKPDEPDTHSRRVPLSLAPSNAKRGFALASLAACLTVAVALGAYRLGEQKTLGSQQLSAASPPPQPGLVPEKRANSELLAAQTAQVSTLEERITSQQQELARLRVDSSLASEKVNEFESAKNASEAELRQLTEERDKLARQVGEAEKAYQSLQTDFANLKADHNRSLLQTASLESQVTELTSANHDRERRLMDDEQFLTSDRDIRELMGARKLYIADVFDVDSASHTRKPFGRVFYTQNKSLVFYAFDLDHQPGVKNASVFQVWGQRDSEPNAGTHPMNLGILYMDSESNRRWVLRSDDPKQLAEIDAVFVTIEPHGGSHKPTGKPLLYALLRKEANHP